MRHGVTVEEKLTGFHIINIVKRLEGWEELTSKDYGVCKVCGIILNWHSPHKYKLCKLHLRSENFKRIMAGKDPLDFTQTVKTPQQDENRRAYQLQYRLTHRKKK